MLVFLSQLCFPLAGNPSGLPWGCLFSLGKKFHKASPAQLPRAWPINSPAGNNPKRPIQAFWYILVASWLDLVPSSPLSKAQWPRPPLQRAPWLCSAAPGSRVRLLALSLFWQLKHLCFLDRKGPFSLAQSLVHLNSAPLVLFGVILPFPF